MEDVIILSYWVLNYGLFYFGFNLDLFKLTMISGFVHASVVSCLSCISLYNYGYDYNRANLFFEELIGKYSLYYFAIDSILLLFDFNLIYILHHFFAMLIIKTILDLGYGSSLLMLMLFLGEITNPFRLAKTMIYNYNKLTYNILNFIFSWSFLFIRCIVMSYYFYYIFYNYIIFLDNYDKYKLLVGLLLSLLGSYYWAYLIIKKKLNYYYKED